MAAGGHVTVPGRWLFFFCSWMSAAVTLKDAISSVTYSPPPLPPHLDCVRINCNASKSTLYFFFFCSTSSSNVWLFIACVLDIREEIWECKGADKRIVFLFFLYPWSDKREISNSQRSKLCKSDLMYSIYLKWPFFLPSKLIQRASS